MMITRQHLRMLILEQLTLNVGNRASWEKWVREISKDEEEFEEDEEEKDFEVQ